MRSIKTMSAMTLMVAVGGGIVALAGNSPLRSAWAWSPPGSIPSRKSVTRPPPEGLIFHREQPTWDDDFAVENFAFERPKRSSSLEALSTTGMHAAFSDFQDVELVELKGDHNDADSFPRSDDSLWKLSFPKRSDEERIEQAYREWCQYYDKTPSETRHKTFGTNFIAVKEYHERTGRPLILNEFADMNEEEYRQHKNSMARSLAPPSNDRIRQAYREWCDYYAKVQDEKRFLAFAANYVAVDKYHKQTKKPLVLNEFADMTKLEYERHWSTSAHMVTSPGRKVLYEEEKTATGTNIIVNGHSISGISSNKDQDPHNFAYLRDQEDPITYPLHTETSLASSIHGQDVRLPAYDDSSLSTMNEVVSRLQSTVSTLSSVLSDSIRNGLPPLQTYQQSNAPPAPPQQQQKPLDALVIDVLQQQEETITQLEDSVDGIRDVQAQSSDLIQMISQNQMQMAEMMSVVQKEVSNLQADLRKSRQGSLDLMNRVRELEEKITVYETRFNQKQEGHKVEQRTKAATAKDGSSVIRSSSQSIPSSKPIIQPQLPATASGSTQLPLQNKRNELKPNPVGVMFRPVGITIGADSEDPPKCVVDPLDEKIIIRPIL